MSLAKKTVSMPIRIVTRLVANYMLALGGERARRRRRAQRLASATLSEFQRLGFTRKVFTKKRVRRQRVEFDYPLLLTRDELWCPIDHAKLPVGVRTPDLQEETVMQSLEDRLGCSVRVDYLYPPTQKLCFIIRIKGASFPERFPISAVNLPANAPPFAFSIGMGEDGEQRCLDLARLPHLLIVGPTNKGKSTLVHNMLTTWVGRNGSEDVEIWLADHKGGVELNRYEALGTGRGRTGIIRRFSYRPVETIAMLQTALTEAERRLEILRRHNCSDLADLGRTTGVHLRPIVILIDEIFFLMLNKERIDPEPGKGKKGGYTIRDWAEQLFAKIASAGRAPGVHLVIATQKIGKDVLTSTITANFESRIVFGTASMYESIYVLGNSSSVGLPKGRVIFRTEGGELSEYQTPWISPDQTRLIISRISRYGPDGGLGRADEARRFRDDAKLLIKVSCEQFEGEFSIRKMYQHEYVKGAIGKDRVEEMARRMERDGVLEPGGPRKPRRVSKGFFNRIHMLDTLYGPEDDDPSRPDEPPDVAQQNDYVRPDPDTSGSQQDALETDTDDCPDTSGVRGDSHIMSPPDENAGPDVELPGSIDTFLHDLSEPEEKRKPKRRKG
jgi:hypothetical protein